MVMRVIKELFRIPRVLNTANSYVLSSTSVCISEKIKMKLKKHTKNMTVASTLFSMYSTILCDSILENIGVLVVK